MGVGTVCFIYGNTDKPMISIVLILKSVLWLLISFQAVLLLWLLVTERGAAGGKKRK